MAGVNIFLVIFSELNNELNILPEKYLKQFLSG